MRNYKKYIQDNIIIDPITNCWLWKKSIHKKTGYGQIYNQETQKMDSLHRFVYELYNGKFPSKLFILHKCDVKCCCNPNHLYPGTRKQNTDDMISKKRQAKGDKNGATKIPDKLIPEIRSKYIPYKYSYYKLAKEYGVSPMTIYYIVKGHRGKFHGNPRYV